MAASLIAFNYLGIVFSTVSPPLSAGLSVCLSVCLSLGLSVCLPVGQAGVGGLRCVRCEFNLISLLRSPATQKLLHLTGSIDRRRDRETNG